MTVELILGGARSGKSAYAERLAADSGCAVTVIATAQPLDDEMAQRIAHHRARRPSQWRTIEAPDNLAAAIYEACAPGRFVLVDCLTLWATNHLCPVDAPEDHSPDDWHAARDALLAALANVNGRVVLISNEIGWGVVPMGAATRHFVDEVGRLNQRIARLCDRVTLVAAGLPLRLKPAP